MKKFLYIVLGGVLLSACTSESEKTHLRTEQGPRDKSANVHANSLLTMEVEGMSCEMNCGGSIRMKLKGTGSVERVSFDFVEDQKKQKTYVYFDSATISKDEIITIIRSMNNKQFDVSNWHVEAWSDSTDVSDTKVKSSKEDAAVDMSEENFEFPNLINILKDLVVN